MEGWGDGGGVKYGVDLEIPRLAGCVEVDDDFVVLQAQLFQHNVRAVCPWAAMICV